MTTQETTSPLAHRTVTERGPLSCIVHTRAARRRWLHTSHFDVPAECYGAGNVTGMRIAAEFMRAVRSGRPGFDPLAVIVDACLALRESDGTPSSCDVDSPSKRGAAVGFLRLMEEFIKAASNYGENYIDGRIKHLEVMERKSQDEAKARGAAFARRMEIAKAAKARAAVRRGPLAAA